MSDCDSQDRLSYSRENGKLDTGDELGLVPGQVTCQLLSQTAGYGRGEGGILKHVMTSPTPLPSGPTRHDGTIPVPWVSGVTSGNRRGVMAYRSSCSDRGRGDLVSPVSTESVPNRRSPKSRNNVHRLRTGLPRDVRCQAETVGRGVHDLVSLVRGSWVTRTSSPTYYNHQRERNDETYDFRCSNPCFFHIN